MGYPSSQIQRFGGGRIPLVVGGVLLVAAILKARLLLAGGSSSNAFQIVQIEIEVACGLSLWLNVWPRITRWAALLLFVAFFGVALSQVVAGASSCACFGNVQLHPWFAVVLDVGMLGALIRWNPRQGDTPDRFPMRYAWIVPLGVLVVFPVALFGLGRSDAYPHLEVSPATVDLGIVLRGERRVFVLRVRNPHAKTVTIHRMLSSCPCLEAQGLPWEFPADQDKTVACTLDLAREPEFVGRLLIDFDGQTATVGAGLSGRVTVTVPSP